MRSTIITSFLFFALPTVHASLSFNMFRRQGTGTCPASQTNCDSILCAPAGYYCCNDGSGNFCITGKEYCSKDGCCPNGKTCVGSTTEFIAETPTLAGSGASTTRTPGTPTPKTPTTAGSGASTARTSGTPTPTPGTPTPGTPTPGTPTPARSTASSATPALATGTNAASAFGSDGIPGLSGLVLVAGQMLLAV